VPGEHPHDTGRMLRRPPLPDDRQFYRDIVGDLVRPQWRTQVRDAFTRAEIVDSASPDWFEEGDGDE
jgi:hypothetical protein